MAHEDLHAAAQGVVDAGKAPHRWSGALERALDTMEDAVRDDPPVGVFNHTDVDTALVLAQACEQLAHKRPHGALAGEHEEWTTRRKLLEGLQPLVQ